MNRIYKVVWSKLKNCYVVASELAKSHTKAPKSGVFNRSLVAGVLASVLSFSVVPSVFSYQAEFASVSCDFIFYGDSETRTITHISFGDYGEGNYGDTYSFGSSSGSVVAINGLSANGRTITYTKTDGSTGTITTQDTDTTYSAGHGVSLSGTTFSAKAGTNVTVNSNGISVTGNGSVASGDTGLIDGGKLYSEVRPSDNGNYVIQLELYNFTSSFPLFCSFLTIP